MNAPARIARPSSPDYDVDGYGWALAQAALLREKRYHEVDWKNIIEEIECVGRQERSEYESHLIRILAHMLKWEVQPERRGMSWWLSIMNGRDDAERCLAKNPSLKPHLDEIFQEALRYARRRAEQETGVEQARFAAVNLSYTDAIAKALQRPESA